MRDPPCDDALAASSYDRLYAGDDHVAEAEAVRRVIEHRAPRAETLLEVACGTGRHLQQLARHYRCEGLDRDPHLLRIARERCAQVPLHLADMTSLALARSFDAVVCLSGGLAYTRTRAGLAGTVARFASHLAPQGLLVVEPWYSPSTWAGWRVKADFVDEPELKIARIGRATRRGRLVALDFDYLYGTAERIAHFQRRAVLALFEPEDYTRAFAAAGLKPEHAADAGPLELVVGRRL